MRIQLLQLGETFPALSPSIVSPPLPLPLALRGLKNKRSRNFHAANTSHLCVSRSLLALPFSPPILITAAK